MIRLIDAIGWAKDNTTAIPAINIFSLDFMVFIAQFAKRYNWPIIIQTSTKTVNYYGVPTVVAMFNAIKGHYDAPIFLHLDHCNNTPLIKECVTSGYDSIMADFSFNTLDDNIRKFDLIALSAKRVGCLVEGEVGELGKEDGQGSENKSHTSIEDAQKFTSSGKVDLFAPVFGNAHGNYKDDNPFLDFDLFEKIASKINVPLVLHGTTGLSPVQIKRCIILGTIKINYSTVFKNGFNTLIHRNHYLPLESKDPFLFNKNLKTIIFNEFENIYNVLNSNQVRIG